MQHMEPLRNAPPPNAAAAGAADDRSYYSIAQAAALLGVSRVSIWRWIRDGRLPAARLGHRTTRITRADLEHLLTRQGSSGFRSGPAHHPGGTADGILSERAPRADWCSVGPTEHLV